MPRVSIGLPVYNGAATLRAALDSLLGQTLTDFDLIISDNASADDTGAICLEYAARDPRIRYIRQTSNIGAVANFAFVLREAKSPLFMWAAADDTRTKGFLDATVPILENVANGYVSASSLSSFEGSVGRAQWRPLFGVTQGQRFRRFLDICWKSHATFYGVTRIEILRSYPFYDDNFAATDWAIDLWIAKHGKLYTSNQESITFGRHGVSSSANAWAAFRSKPIEHVFPLYRFSVFAAGLARELPFWDRLIFLTKLTGVNVAASYNNAFSTAYQFYRQHFRNRNSNT